MPAVLYQMRDYEHLRKPDAPKKVPAIRKLKDEDHIRIILAQQGFEEASEQTIWVDPYRKTKKRIRVNHADELRQSASRLMCAQSAIKVYFGDRFVEQKLWVPRELGYDCLDIILK